MRPRKYEIYFARIPFRDCDDPRFWVVLEASAGDRVKVAPISSQFDLFEPGRDFRIGRSDDGFSETGLTRESFVKGSFVAEVDADLLTRRRGHLSREVLDAFREWCGDS